MSYIGANKIGGMYLGSATIAKAYLGSTLVFQKSGVTPPQPSPYDSKVEYLRNTGGSYINTGINANYNNHAYSWRFRMKFTSAAAYMGSNANIVLAYSSGKFGIPSGMMSTSYDNGIWDFQLDVGTNKKRTAVINGVSLSGSNASNTTNPIYIFALGGTTAYKSKGYLYWSQIYEDGVLIQDLIPVRVGQVGYMYDNVSLTFFGNDGTDDFTIGNDIT